MIVRFIKRLAHDQAGATAIEYGLILAVIVVAIMTAVLALADTTTRMWGNIDDKVQRATTEQ